jgi:hypothetical protein
LPFLGHSAEFEASQGCLCRVGFVILIEQPASKSLFASIVEKLAAAAQPWIVISARATRPGDFL